MTKHPITKETTLTKRKNAGHRTKPGRAAENEADYREANVKPPYDLEERTALFGERVIDFARTVPVTTVTRPLVGQLVRAGTSVGANYCEADDAGSGKDFRHKIGLCKREARETKHWLRMIARARPELKEQARSLWLEAKELHLIFAAIGRGKKRV